MQTPVVAVWRRSCLSKCVNPRRHRPDPHSSPPSSCSPPPAANYSNIRPPSLRGSEGRRLALGAPRIRDSARASTGTISSCLLDPSRWLSHFRFFVIVAVFRRLRVTERRRKTGWLSRWTDQATDSKRFVAVCAAFSYLFSSFSELALPTTIPRPSS
jgi:hypothetical protein